MKQSPPELVPAVANDTARRSRRRARRRQGIANGPVDGFRLPDLPPQFADLVALWQANREAGAPPRRTAINPAELPARLLPYMCVIERRPGPDGPRLQLRLAGSGVERAAGRPLTGAWVDEIAPIPAGYAGWLRQHLDAAFAHALPVFAEGVFVSAAGDAPTLLATRKLLLPLADADGSVRFALGAQTFAGTPAPRPVPFLQADTFRPGRAGPVAG